MKVPYLAAVTLSLALPLAAQVMPPVDPSLMRQINQLKAIDNHAHPPALVSSGEKDDDFDALPCDSLEPTTPGLLFRQDNPIYPRRGSRCSATSMTTLRRSTCASCRRPN